MMTREQNKEALRVKNNTIRQKRKLLKELIEKFDLAPINVNEESKLNEYLNVKPK